MAALMSSRLKLFLQAHAISKQHICCKTYLTPGDRNILSLHDRGVFVHIFPDDMSPALYNKLMGKPQHIYCGFDATADSLHIGNLLAVIALIHCQRAGHKVLALIGGATALIGDPSGRTKDREPLAVERVEKNAHSLQDSLHRIFSNHKQYIWKGGGGGASHLEAVRILDNAKWYGERNVVEFLSTVGRAFRVGSMLNKDSVKIRLNSSEGMNFTEFSYPVFQAYDFLHLYKEYGCAIQIGGTDQIANISSGHDLIKRASRKDAFGLTIPLLTTASGEKLGKTAGNAVWLNQDKTSPFELYQFFLNLKDTDVEKYLKLFTFLSTDSVKTIIYEHKRKPEDRQAQKTIAEEVTKLVHGEPGLNSAQRCTRALFHDNPEALAELSLAEINEISKNVPLSNLTLEPGTSVMDLVLKIKCFGREVDADRIIKGGGLFINHQRVTEPEYVLIRGQHVLHNNITFVRVGKKKNYLVKWADL